MVLHYILAASDKDMLEGLLVRVELLKDMVEEQSSQGCVTDIPR